jgi:hypothetical protein
MSVSEYIVILLEELLKPYHYVKATDEVPTTGSSAVVETQFLSEEKTDKIVVKIIKPSEFESLIYLKSPLYPKILSIKINSQEYMTKARLKRLFFESFIFYLFPPHHAIPSFGHLSTIIIVQVGYFLPVSVFDIVLFDFWFVVRRLKVFCQYIA